MDCGTLHHHPVAIERSFVTEDRLREPHGVRQLLRLGMSQVHAAGSENPADDGHSNIEVGLPRESFVASEPLAPGMKPRGAVMHALRVDVSAPSSPINSCAAASGVPLT